MGYFLGVKTAASNTYNLPPTANKVLRPIQENNWKVISFPLIGLKESRIRPPVLLTITVLR
jgi:hypothetical protein